MGVVQEFVELSADQRMRLELEYQAKYPDEFETVVAQCRAAGLFTAEDLARVVFYTFFAHEEEAWYSYNVTLALWIVANLPKRRKLCQYAVDSQVPNIVKGSVDIEKALAIDLDAAPPVITVTRRDEKGKLCFSLIDGQHRTYKAHSLGRTEVPCYVLDEEASAACRMPHHVTEMCARLNGAVL
jgi:hypothetical protein